jgi:hypothetical protein
MLGFLNRRPKLAADRRPTLDRDERIVAWAQTPDEHVVVATNRGLWLPGRGRLGWHDIHKAAWSGQELRITAGEVAEERDGYTVLVDEHIQAYALPEPGDLPDQVRTRVTRSVAFTSHHPLPGGAGVRIVARRVSGVDGLRWTVRPDTGTALDADGVRQTTDDLIRLAKELIAGG